MTNSREQGYENQTTEPVEISTLLGSLLDTLFVRAYQHRLHEREEAGSTDDERMKFLNDPELLEQAQGDITRLQELITLRLAELRLQEDPENPDLQRQVLEARQTADTYDKDL
jgi:hypothetical protein